MDNPYASPSSNLRGSESFGTGAGVSQRVADIMRRTQPWTRIAGITSIISAVINIIAMAQQSGRADRPSSAGTIIGIIISFYLAAKLLGYSKKIGDLLQSGSASDLAAALAEHRRYWKVNGILLLIVMIFVVIGILAGIAVGSR